jgi:hypothetical protein
MMVMPVVALGRWSITTTGFTIAGEEKSEAMTDTPEYHAVNGDDAVGILTVLQDVAPEIPLSLDTPRLTSHI